ncbi:MAG: hypothetical protein R3B96_02075 [Pirellulaceae bacterium]
MEQKLELDRRWAGIKRIQISASPRTRFRNRIRAAAWSVKAKLTPATESDLLRELIGSSESRLDSEASLQTEFFNALERIKHDPICFRVNHTGYRAVGSSGLPASSEVDRSLRTTE